MRAKTLQNYWIMMRLGFVVLEYSLRLLFLVFFSRKYPRDKINSLNYISSKKLLAVVKAKCKVCNPFNVKIERGQRYIIMSNHCSHFDIPLIFITFPRQAIRMIAKKELFKIPIFGTAMKKNESLTVDRNSRKQAQLDLHLVQEKIADGIIPWVAPEGTRSRTGELQPFKKGGFLLALETKATIIPVGIKGSRRILPTKTFQFGIGEEIELHIAKPINVANYSVKSIKELMQLVEGSIRGEQQ